MKAMTPLVALILTITIAAPAFGQTPPPAAPVAPVPPVPPVAPAPVSPVDVYEFEFDFAEHAKALKEQAKRIEAQFKTKDFEHAIRAREEALEQLSRQMAELRWQLPAPPAVMGLPGDAREQAREAAREARERREAERQKQPKRRIPEGSVESTEPFTRSFKVGRGAALTVSNISGNIQVSAGGNDQIEVQATKRAWAGNAEQAKQRLGDATIEPYVTGNRVELRVEHVARKEGRGIEVEFDVKVPADASVELRTVSGDLRITNVNGEVRAQGVSGNVLLEGTRRVALAKSVSGDIALTNAGADAQLSVTTVSGNLIATTLAARTLDVNTVSGDVRIGGWSGERALIRALSGDVDLETSLVKAGRYEIESHSGDVRLALPEQSGFDLDSHTFSGRIRVDFAIKTEGPVRNTDRGPRSVRGLYGDGSSSLRVHTFSGDLTITRK